MTATAGERRVIAKHFILRGGTVLVCSSIGVAFWGSIVWLALWGAGVV